MLGGCSHGEIRLVSQVLTSQYTTPYYQLLAQQGTLGRAPEWLKYLIPPPPLRAGESGPQPRGFGATRGPAAAPPRQPAGYNWGAGQRLGDQ